MASHSALGILLMLATPVNLGAISQTGADVTMNLDALQALAEQGKLRAIRLTDGGTPTLVITAAQLAANARVLSAIVSPFKITATGTIGAAAAVGIPATLLAKLTAGIAVSDDAAKVAANLAPLQALATKGSLATIVLTDRDRPTLAISAAQLRMSDLVLGSITGEFSISATRVSASDAPTIASTPHVDQIAVLDSVSSVAANLDRLQVLAAAGRLASIALTDSGKPTLAISATQLAASAAALDRITSPVDIVATGPIDAAAAAAVPPTLAARLTQGLAVSDTAAHVETNLAALEALAAAGKLASITLSNASTPTLTLPPAQLAAAATALSKITTTYHVAVRDPAGIAPPDKPTPRSGQRADRYSVERKREAVGGWSLDVRRDEFTEDVTCKLWRGPLRYRPRALIIQLSRRLDTSNAAYRVDNGDPVWTRTEDPAFAALGFAIHNDTLTNSSGGIVRIPEERVMDALTLTIQPKPGASSIRFDVDGLRAALDAADKSGCNAKSFK